MSGCLVLDIYNIYIYIYIYMYKSVLYIYVKQLQLIYYLNATCNGKSRIS